MASSHTHEQPPCSVAAWEAAVDALRAGGSVPQVVKTMRLAEPTRARIKTKLDAMRRRLVLDPSLSLPVALSRLADIRRDELERPLVEATESLVEPRKALIENSRFLRHEQNALANQLRDINDAINQIDRAGLGTSKRPKLIVRHNQTVAELLDVYERFLLLLDNAETVEARATALADRGLMLAGHSVKEVRELGGVQRSDRHIYRSKDKLADPPSSDHWFTQTFRELMPLHQSAHAEIADSRADIESDLQRLKNAPGATDVPCIT